MAVAIIRFLCILYIMHRHSVAHSNTYPHGAIRCGLSNHLFLYGSWTVGTECAQGCVFVCGRKL